MLSRELLHEIRSMNSSSAAERAHTRLVNYLKSEAMRLSPSTYTLCQCSIMCGAFCRRLARLDASVVSDAVDYVESLRAAITTVASPAQEAALFAYAVGEIDAFRSTRRVACRQRVDDLTKSTPASRWDLEKITRCLRELSASERCPTKPHTQRGAVKRLRESIDVGAESVPVAVSWRLPLKDPISLAAIAIPARGESCQHKEVFDLTAFVRAVQQAVMRRGESFEELGTQQWNTGASSEAVPAVACPVCGIPIQLQNLRVDEHIMAAMRQHMERGGQTCADDFVLWDAESSAYVVVERAAEAPVTEHTVEEVP